jgi:hypothetical protein
MVPVHKKIFAGRTLERINSCCVCVCVLQEFLLLKRKAMKNRCRLFSFLKQWNLSERNRTW